MKMRNVRKGLLVLMTSVMLMGTVQQAFAAETEGSAVVETEAVQTEAATTPEKETVKVVRKGLVKIKGNYYYYKKGKKVRKTWKTIKGKKYYFKSNGKAAIGVTKINGIYYMFKKNGVLQTASKTKLRTVDGKKYLVNKEGKLCTGFQNISGNMYYFSADKKSYGQMMKNTTVNGVQLKKDGTVSPDAMMVKAHVKAQGILNAITSAGMSQGQKLQAAWNYVVSHVRYASNYPNLANGLWPRDMGYTVLCTNAGNCYGYACAFAALAYEIGYRPILVTGRVPGSRDGAADGYTRHCWVQIGGLSYDPEAQAAGWARGIYGSHGYPIGYSTGSYSYRLY